MSNTRKLAAPVLLMPRCNPFGQETGGPRHLLGGMYGPEHEGRYKWQCERTASGRYRMECQCGHQGQVMSLCGPGLVQDPQGEYYQHPGHVAEIQKRNSDSCPRCLFPPAAAELAKAAESAMSELGRLEASGLVLSPRAATVRKGMAAMQARLDEMNALGEIHKCPLMLSEVS